MKIQIFNTLETVLRTGTLAAAAKALHMTPSAASLQIKKLETYMGQQLFDRSGLQLKPLPMAAKVSEAMQEALNRLEVLRRERSVVVEGNIELGIIESMQPLLLPHLVEILAQDYPALRVQPHRGKSAALTNAVKAGDLDAAIVAQPAGGGSSRLHWHRLHEQRLSLIVPPGEADSCLVSLFQRYEWIRYDRKTITGALAAKYVKKHVRAGHGNLELDGVRAIASMVSAGLDISLVQLTEPGISLMYPVRILELEDAPMIRFSLVMRKTDAEARALLALTRILDAAFATIVSGEPR